MKHGDFIKIDFVGRVAGTGQVFDFTQESVAKEEGISDSKKKYGPTLVIVGAHMVIPGVEKQLEKMKVGEEKKFTVPIGEAFGPRNPRLMKVFSMSAFLKEKVNPTPGSFVQIEGLQGKVQSVSSGRVRVDFNHPLAGKELDYRVKIVDVIEKPEEKIKALFSRYQIKNETEIKDGILIVKGKLDEQEKQSLRELVTQWVKEIKDIKFSEKSK